MKIIKLLITFSIIFSSVFVYADLQDALKAYEMQNFESAHKQFMQLAEVGNADAFYNLGVMHFKGQYVDKDYQQAYAWMSLASKYDDFFTTVNVEKKLSKQEKANAETIFSELNQQYGYEIFKNKYLPKFNSTDEYMYDNSLPIPLVKVAPIYPKRAAEKRVAGVVIVSYKVHSDGSVDEIEILSEYPEKYNFAKKALGATKKFKYKPWDASIDSTSEYHYMVNMFYFETALSLQQKDKLDQLVNLSNENNAKAQFALANYITPIHNVIVSPEYSRVKNTRSTFVIPEMKTQGNELLLSSAVNGDVYAQVFLGMRLLLGHDVETDRNKAINWLEQATANGSEFAKKQLDALDVQ